MRRLRIVLLVVLVDTIGSNTMVRGQRKANSESGQLQEQWTVNNIHHAAADRSRLGGGRGGSGGIPV